MNFCFALVNGKAYIGNDSNLKEIGRSHMIEKKYLKKIGLFLSIVAMLSIFTSPESSTQQPCGISIVGTGQFGPNGLFVTLKNNDDDQKVTLCIQWGCACRNAECPLPRGSSCKTFNINKGQISTINFRIQHIPPCEYDCAGHLVTSHEVSCERIVNEPPKAILDVRDEKGFQPSSAEAPLQIQIKASGEDDKKVVKYQLIVKIENKEMVNIVRGNPITISRVLKEPGTYEITLYVWDAEGEMDSVTKEIWIEEKIEIAEPLGGEPLTATITNLEGDELEVKIAGTNRWVKPEIGMKLPQGSIVATGTDSKITLKFESDDPEIGANTVVGISELSNIQIDQFL
ncbi:MAG: hypothetical protein ACE5HW_06655, partial [Candidatus Methanofastidiosia archaeon]